MGNDPLTPNVISYSRVPNKPLIYSCSGCSNIAQVAIELDRQNLAERSCIAGVGGAIKKRKHFDYDEADVKSIKHLVITNLKL